MPAAQRRNADRQRIDIERAEEARHVQNAIIVAGRIETAQQMDSPLLKRHAGPAVIGRPIGGVRRRLGDLGA
jgi:hypothetical protein